MPRRITIQENHGCYSLILHSDEEQIADEIVNELTIHQVTLQAKRYLMFGDRNQTLPYKKRNRSLNGGGTGQGGERGDKGIQQKEDVEGREVKTEEKNGVEPDQRSQGGETDKKEADSWLRKVFKRSPLFS